MDQGKPPLSQCPTTIMLIEGVSARRLAMAELPGRSLEEAGQIHLEKADLNTPSCTNNDLSSGGKAIIATRYMAPAQEISCPRKQTCMPRADVPLRRMSHRFTIN
jgi:hypothetical protein